jgi:hypothetical protein
MKRFWLSLLTASLLALAAFAPAAAQESVTIDLDELNDSGQSGTATLTEENGQTRVVIDINAPEEEDIEQPAHIHAGTCDDLGGVEYPLDNVVDGSSETVVDVSLEDLMSGVYAVNVHLSTDEPGTWVACGNIPTQVEDENGEDMDDEDMDDEEADDDADDPAALPAAGGPGANSGMMAGILAIIAAVMAGVGILVRRRSTQLKS